MSIEVLSSAFASAKGPRSEMQDDVIPFARTKSSVGLTAVLDGHGAHGWEAAFNSSFALNAVRETDLPAEDTACEVARVIKSVSSDLGLIKGGSTVTAVVVGDGQLHVVQLGDSEAVYFPESGGYERLASVHDLSNESEVERVQSQGGRVGLIEGSEYLVLPSEDGFGLKVSRSVGDNHFGFVGHEPELTSHNLNRLGKGILVVGTDGIWGRNQYGFVAETIRTNQELTDAGNDGLKWLARSFVDTCGKATGDNTAVSILKLGAR